jgi:hypothetical protein
LADLPDAVELPPIRFAPLVAPVIDRVAIDIHLRANPSARRLATDRGLSRLGGLVEFRAALLAGPMARSTAEAVARYFSAGALDEEIEVMVDEGMLIVAGSDGAFVLTAAGEEVVHAIFDLHAEITAEAWSARADELPRLVELVGRLLEAGRATGGPAFAGMGRPHERPGDPPALVLFNRLSALRYHRADAHAAAWAAAGQTADGIRAMAPGAEREAIEADTNRRAAPPYAALSPDERLELLAGLAALG